MCRDTERYTDDRERQAREGKRKPLVDLGPACAALPFALALELFEQLLKGQGGAARSFFLFVVKLVETDWQRTLGGIDPVADLVEIGRIIFISLLVTRIVE